LVAPEFNIFIGGGFGQALLWRAAPDGCPTCWALASDHKAVVMTSYLGRSGAILFHLAVGLGLGVLGTLGLRWGLNVPHDWEHWKHWLGCWLVAVNGVAFGYYAFDKFRACQTGSRMLELALHGLAVVGGSLGAYAGMEVFRHKTLRGGFRVVFGCLVVLETAVILWLIWIMWPV
jgi:uncharacterized membrane protein YsdA (DUF1294 family)